MARKKKRKGKNISVDFKYRDNNNISRRNKLIFEPFQDDFQRKKKKEKRLNQIEDRRSWIPDAFKIYYTLTGQPVEYYLSRRSKYVREARYLRSFKSPWKVITCVRRRIRREILFKKNKVGRGKRVREKRRWVESSHIKC